MTLIHSSTSSPCCPLFCLYFCSLVYRGLNTNSCNCWSIFGNFWKASEHLQLSLKSLERYRKFVTLYGEGNLTHQTYKNLVDLQSDPGLGKKKTIPSFEASRFPWLTSNVLVHLPRHWANPLDKPHSIPIQFHRTSFIQIFFRHFLCLNVKTIQ